MEKNIIFIMTDQHRLDHVSYHGEGKIETPHIDRIAESAGFTKCQTVNPICTPARTALLTGKYTHQIGTLAMSGDLSRQHPTYLRALQKAGYHTSGIGKFHFLQTWKWNMPSGNHLDLVAQKEEIAKYGFDYIWEASGKQLSRQNRCDYIAHLEEKGLADKYRSFVDTAGSNANFLLQAQDDGGDGDPSPLADEDYVDILVGDQVVSRIVNRPKDKPFFIFGSFCSPHKPMDPPPSYLERVPYEEEDDFITGGEHIPDEHKKKLYKRRRSYKAMIKLVDDQVGRIFQTLENEGILDDTVILFTADHGEMMGDHMRIQKTSWYKESCTVPAAVRHPDYLGGKILDTPVELTDLTATILDAAGLDYREVLSKEWPAFHDIVPCRSLMPLVRGEADRIREFTFSECNGLWQMIQDERYKYAVDLRYDEPGRMEEVLLDTQSDPEELVNLAQEEEYREVLSLMRERRQWINDTTPPAQTRWAKLSEEGEAYSYPQG